MASYVLGFGVAQWEIKRVQAKGKGARVLAGPADQDATRPSLVCRDDVAHGGAPRRRADGAGHGDQLYTRSGAGGVRGCWEGGLQPAVRGAGWVGWSRLWEGLGGWAVAGGVRGCWEGGLEAAAWALRVVDCILQQLHTCALEQAV